MLLRAASGKLIPFTHHELLYLFGRLWFHGFILLGAFGAASFHPFERPPEHDYIVVAIFWVIMAYVFMVLFTLAITLATTLPAKLNWKWAYEPPFTLVAVTMATFIGTQVAFWMSVYIPMTGLERIKNIAINFATVQVFILIYVHILRNRVYHPEQSSQSATKKASDNSRVFVGGGKSIHEQQIMIIEAQGHYVRVQTNDASTMTRARFTNVIAQMPPQLGIQIHRSIWIAVRIVSNVRKTHGTITIVLDDGEELKVARPRQADVAAKLRAHGHVF